MELFTASALLLLGMVAFIACIPQLLKIIKLKNSNQFSKASWTIFFLYQLSSLLYAINIASVPYIILNVLWVSFYATMLGLIFYFGSNSYSE